MSYISNGGPPKVSFCQYRTSGGYLLTKQRTSRGHLFSKEIFKRLSRGFHKVVYFQWRTTGVFHNLAYCQQRALRNRLLPVEKPRGPHNAVYCQQRTTRGILLSIKDLKKSPVTSQEIVVYFQNCEQSIASREPHEVVNC